MAKHEKRTRGARGAGGSARGAERSLGRGARPVALSVDQEAEVASLLAQVPALGESLRAAGPQGREAVAAQLAEVQATSEPAQQAFAARLGDVRGPTARAAAEVANALGELSPAHAVAREARRARIRLRSAGALPTLTLVPVARARPQSPEMMEPAPRTPQLVEAHVGRAREEGEIPLVLAWQEGNDPDIVRGCSMLLDFWQGGVRDFMLTSPMRRQRFLEDTLHALRAEDQIETVAVTWAQARRLVLEALDVNAWRGSEPSPDYRRHQAWLAARLLDVPDTDEARSAVAQEAERAAREGDRPYMAGDLDPDELVATWLGTWCFGDYGAVYDALADDHPIRQASPREEYIQARRAWADEAQPASLRLTLVREQAQRASALWVPGAGATIAPGGRREVEAFWSITVKESPLGGTISELPLATLTSQETGRHWYWTAYTVERDPGAGAWRIARTRDEGAASQSLTIEELQQRTQEARATAEKITSGPPPDPNSDTAADLLRELSGALVTAMHYRDALIVRLPLDEALYRASVADAQVIRNYERAAALLERMRSRFPGQARTLFELGIQYYLVALQLTRSEDVSAERLWLERAANAMRQAVDLDPSAEHVQALGEILARQGHYTQAVTRLREAIAKDPGRASAHSDLADALMSEVSGENLDEMTPTAGLTDAEREQRTIAAARAALAELRDAVRLDPNLPAVFTRMGAIYDVLGQRDDALIAFEEAVRHDPNDAEARYTLGTIYLDRREPARALPELEAAARLSPTSPAIRVGLAASYAALERRRDAERELDFVDEIRPGMPQVAEMRARLAHLKML